MSEDRPKVSLMFDIFRVAGRYETAMRQALRDQPVTPLGYAVLSLLRREGPHTPSAMATTLGAPKSSLTTPLRDLERAGLIARRPTPADGRSHELALTDLGVATHQDLVVRMRTVLDPTDAPPLDTDRLRQELATLAAYLDEQLGGL